MTAYIEMPSTKVRELCVEARMALDSDTEQKVIKYREVVEEKRKSFWGRIFNSKDRAEETENYIWQGNDWRKEQIYKILRLANNSNSVCLSYDDLELLGYLF